MKRWLKHVLITLDQFVNAICLGWPDETLSSRAHRMQGRRLYWAVARILIDAVFFWETDHCKTSFESERSGRHLPPEMREKL